MSADENKALVVRWFQELDQRNFAIIDELLPADYVDHNPPLPDLPSGREGVRQSSLRLASAFPDAVHTIEDQMAEGDKVMTRLMVRATFLGEILGGLDHSADLTEPPRRLRPFAAPIEAVVEHLVA